MCVCVCVSGDWLERRRRSVGWSPGSYSSLLPPPPRLPTLSPPPPLSPLHPHPSSSSYSPLPALYPILCLSLYPPSYRFLTHLLSHSLRLYPDDDCQVQFGERTPDCTVSGGFVRSSTGVGSFFNAGNDDSVRRHPDCCCHCSNVQWIL